MSRMLRGPKDETKTAPKPKSSRARKKVSRRKKGNGPGYGGPAKGAGKKTPRFKFTEPGPGRGNFSLKGEARKEANERRAETLYAFLYAVVLSDSNDPSHTVTTRVQAANSLLNRLQGMPVQMVATVTPNDLSLKTDEEIEQAAEGLGRKLAAFRAGALAADVPERPPSLEHRSDGAEGLHTSEASSGSN